MIDMFRNSKSRMEAISDGVFAVVLTIMVLDIKAPMANISDYEIQRLMMQLLSYLISFGVVAQYWVLHQELFTTLKTTTFKIMVANIYYLCPICLVPFATTWLSSSFISSESAIGFAILMFIVNVSQLWLFHLVIEQNRHDGQRIIEHDVEEFRSVKVMVAISIVYIGVSLLMPKFLLAAIALGILSRVLITRGIRFYLERQ
ncbi:hypothetical protein G8J22_02624 [Lentilactobacillus hilgardii]|nr:hypothetical protein HMPREF0497_0105 [Lentilactobacillus buchneri ATCC 11577]MCT3396126.1 DUF1211 domain-containing protein [Lentilactobacillus hilgardii]QIR10613.1 hypothetical protein G8J22_02624 [Lentilactobacillus hilgardii]